MATDIPDARRVVARGWVRKMAPGVESGGSDPHLFLCDDGNHYLVKANNNPQGLRVLVNELVGGLGLDWLGVKHPAPAIVDVPDEVLEDASYPTLSNGQPFAGGLSWGSEHWQSDDYHAVRPAKIANKDDIAGTFVFDSWVRPHDGRQCRVRPMAAFPDTYQWFPVDQGYSFGSPDWTPDALRADLVPAFGPEVVPFPPELVESYAARLESYTQAHAQRMVEQVPVHWLDDGHREALILYLADRAEKTVGLMKTYHKP